MNKSLAIVSESFSTAAAYEHSNIVVMYSTHPPEVRSPKLGAVGGWVGGTVGAACVGANVPT